MHRAHELPDDVEEAVIPAAAVTGGKVWLPRLLTELGLVGSNSEGRRQIEQGGLRIDGVPVADASLEYEPDDLAGRVIQVGRRRFLRIAGPGQAG